MKPGKPALRIAQISDTHLRAGVDAQWYGEHAEQNLARVLAHIRRHPPDLLVASGDLTDRSEPEALQRLYSQLMPLSCDTLLLPGNHDADLPELSGQRYPICRQIQGVQIVALNSAVAGSHAGWVDAKQLAAVPQCPGDMFGLVFVHHPPVPIGSPWADRQNLKNSGQVLQKLTMAGYRAVAFGHVHHPYDGHAGVMRVLGAPAVFSASVPGKQHFQAAWFERPGYRTFQINPTTGLKTGLCYPTRSG